MLACRFLVNPNQYDPWSDVKISNKFDILSLYKFVAFSLNWQNEDFMSTIYTSSGTDWFLISLTLTLSNFVQRKSEKAFGFVKNPLGHVWVSDTNYGRYNKRADKDFNYVYDFMF